MKAAGSWRIGMQRRILQSFVGFGRVIDIGHVTWGGYGGGFGYGGFGGGDLTGGSFGGGNGIGREFGNELKANQSNLPLVVMSDGQSVDIKFKVGDGNRPFLTSSRQGEGQQQFGQLALYDGYILGPDSGGFGGGGFDVGRGGGRGGGGSGGGLGGGGYSSPQFGQRFYGNQQGWFSSYFPTFP